MRFFKLFELFFLFWHDHTSNMVFGWESKKWKGL